MQQWEEVQPQFNQKPQSAHLISSIRLMSIAALASFHAPVSNLKSLAARANVIGLRNMTDRAHAKTRTLWSHDWGCVEKHRMIKDKSFYVKNWPQWSVCEVVRVCNGFPISCLACSAVLLQLRVRGWSWSALWRSESTHVASSFRLQSDHTRRAV